MKRQSHRWAKAPVTVQPGSSPIRARRIKVWTALIASSIRLAVSQQAGADIEQQDPAEFLGRCARCRSGPHR